jgi:hypothetical protein
VVEDQKSWPRMARVERPAWPHVARVDSAQVTGPRVAQATVPRVAQVTGPRVAQATGPHVARARRSSEVQPAHSREKNLQARACAAIQWERAQCQMRPETQESQVWRGHPAQRKER